MENHLGLSSKEYPNMEKVLNHYSKNPEDSLKFKAALFLINGMEGRGYYASESIKEYYEKVDSVNALSFNIDSLTYPDNDNVLFYPDHKFVTSELLISHIDKAFEGWQHPRAQHLNFEEFCEYLLPHRLGYEKTENWMQIYWNFYKSDPKLDSLLSLQDTSIYNLRLIADQIIKRIDATTIYKSCYFGGHTPSQMLNMKFAPCNEMAELGIYTFRSMGISVAFDYTPQWATEGMGHSWIAFPIDKGKKLDYGFPEPSEFLGNHLAERWNAYFNKSAKVYRKLYSIQQNSLAILSSNREEIPEQFFNPHIIDVTNLYYECVDSLEVNVEKLNIKNEFAYLCNFNNKNWIPVAWGRVQNGKARFGNLGKEIIYLPAYFNKNRELIPAAYPFILTKDGNILTLDPDTLKQKKIVTSRKYPDTRMLKYAERLIGGKFQVANNPDFSDQITIHEIKERPEVTFTYVDLKLDKKYQYFRYFAPPSKVGGHLAEVQLYEKGFFPNEIRGRIFGNNDTGARENAFDNDPLTIYYSFVMPEMDFIGIDFIRPFEIVKLRYLPHNDDNFVSPDQIYELFYWNNEWKSLGKKTGDYTHKLIWENAPTNALFLLKNLSRG